MAWLLLCLNIGGCKYCWVRILVGLNICRFEYDWFVYLWVWILVILYIGVIRHWWAWIFVGLNIGWFEYCWVWILVGSLAPACGSRVGSAGLGGGKLEISWSGQRQRHRSLALLLSRGGRVPWRPAWRSGGGRRCSSTFNHWETDGQRSALRRLLQQPLLLAQGGAAQVQHLTSQIWHLGSDNGLFIRVTDNLVGKWVWARVRLWEGDWWGNLFICCQSWRRWKDDSILLSKSVQVKKDDSRWSKWQQVKKDDSSQPWPWKTDPHCKSDASSRRQHQIWQKTLRNFWSSTFVSEGRSNTFELAIGSKCVCM